MTYIGDRERWLINIAVAGAPPLNDDTIRTLRRLLRPAEMLTPVRAEPVSTAVTVTPMRRRAA